MDGYRIYSNDSNRSLRFRSLHQYLLYYAHVIMSLSLFFSVATFFSMEMNEMQEKNEVNRFSLRVPFSPTVFVCVSKQLLCRYIGRQSIWFRLYLYATRN